MNSVQSAENRRKSVTNSGYAYVTQWLSFGTFERQPQRKKKPDGVNPNSNDIDYYVRKNEEKFYGFRQTALKWLEISMFRKKYLQLIDWQL